MDRLSLTFNINQACKLLAQKGNMVYEYNPFRNFRINTSNDSELGSEPVGALLDLNTSKLKFDLKHPVDMTVLQSYDGSVNIILNDGINEPRMINSRFSVTGKDTYLIVDREGDNDTNIYDTESFNTDISLYKKVTSIAKINFVGLSTGGNLPVGNYHFYFKLSDADGNETDFIGESGLVTCYIGNLNDPYSILGGIRDLSSFKAVHFRLSNLDKSYSNVVVYYTRYTSDNLANKTTEAKKIIKNYPIYSGNCDVRINGYEDLLAVSINDINVQYNLVRSVNTQDVALNMLFLGNVNKTEIPYRELADLSLRFYPQVYQLDIIGNVDEKYIDNTGKYEYYNVQNIYHKLGYWNDEIYRFGVVYIMDDYSLSPVFNIRGRTIIDNTSIEVEPIINNNHRNYIAIDKETFRIDNNSNSKGVGRISGDSLITLNGVKPIGIKIIVGDNNLIPKLKEQGVIGCFFVRQKRIATTLCQAVSMGIEPISHLPVLPIASDKYIIERFLNNDRLLVHSFDERKIEITNVNDSLAALCPEYELNAPFFNLFFTGGEFTLKTSKQQYSSPYYTNTANHYYNKTYTSADSVTYNFRVVSLLDGQALAKNKNSLYSALAGTAEEAFRVSYYGYRSPNKKAANLLRGVYGPYIGLEGPEALPNRMTVFDIKIPNYSEGNYDEYFQIRYLDTSPFEPISERLELDAFDSVTGNNVTTYSTICYRGDCFIGNFTHRMVRNFADPSAPYNDEIIDPNNWMDEMDLSDADTFTKVNRGDVNAVKMGHWATIKVCSNINLSLRSVDHSWASEEGLTNKPRAFFPLYAKNTSGENKVPESNVYNDGYTTTLSTKYNYEMPDIPAVKNVFITRVMYSDIAINDAFRNGFRVFDMTHYRDYTLTYGALTRLVELKGNLIAVFEHGVCLIPVNERAVAGSGAGGNVFINTSNVLPENPLVLSDMFGTLWPESVVKTPYYVYGIDTVGKKIWRTNGQSFDIISDFRVEKFLIDNISLTETEKEPIIGVRNVKSHYNAYKSDVMLTFYDDINTLEEKVWNLCYNEILQQFITLYSWVPSYSANIDNILFTFDRNTSRTITKLANKYSKINLIMQRDEWGSVVYPDAWIANNLIVNLFDAGAVKYKKLGYLSIDGADYVFLLYDDNFNNREKFKIIKTNANLKDYYYLYVLNTSYNNSDYWTVAIKADIVRVTEEEVTSMYVGGTVYGTVTACKSEHLSTLTTHFWKHGQGGLMKQLGDIKPCFWYGKLHPFEFEFVVLDNPLMHKIFNNLEIISNKALPESFHFDVVGQVYDWAYDKLNMFCRLEATRLLFQRLGSNIKYDPNYKELSPKLERILGSQYNLKSTYLPLYYYRKKEEDINNIYDSYTMMLCLALDWNTTPPRDYSHLSGSEIIYDKQLNEFRVWTHIGCCPIDGYYDKEISSSEYNYIIAHFAPTHRRAFAWLEDNGTTKYYERIFYGRIKGNSEYKEDKWYVQIPSITFMLKNEATWNIGEDGKYKPNLVISSTRLPSDIESTQIDLSIMPEGYTLDAVLVLPNTFDRGDAYPPTIGGWTSRKETKIRDKYMRVRIRYTGNDLAVISAIKTIYTESYA